MRVHIREFRLIAMCRVLGVQRSGYYTWLRRGPSARDRDDQRLLGLIKHHWLASGAVYGYRKITLDLRAAGEQAGDFAARGQYAQRDSGTGLPQSHCVSHRL